VLFRGMPRSKVLEILEIEEMKMTKGQAAGAPEPLSWQRVSLLKQLQVEIARRRKENNDEYQKRRWNPDAISKREQSVMLDWIEEELQKI
jgi:hypothetical protein